jgi:hypothetical protein
MLMPAPISILLRPASNLVLRNQPWRLYYLKE